VTIEVTIEKLVFGGEGLAHHEGKACFVEGALPGERVVARVTADKKNFLKARAIKILSTSPSRVKAPCVYVEKCGGCQYQHLDYASELKAKEEQLKEVLAPLNLAPSVFQSIVSSSKDYGYRNSVTLHRSSRENTPQAMSFVGRDNTTKIKIDTCLLIDPVLAKVFEAKYRFGKDQDKVTFKLSHMNDIVSDEKEVFFRVKIGGEELIANSKGFFQNNLAVTALLTAKIKEWVTEAMPDKFYDLYAGVGTFSFLSAPDVSEIVCIEDSLPNTAALAMNKAEKNKTNLSIVTEKVERVFPKIYDEDTSLKRVIFIDPPRQGMSQDLVRFLMQAKKPYRFIYVSCDAATLARDLSHLISSGYNVSKVVPFDMFPRTKHLEIAVLLS
jgi:tRNA/tmRNA/rRNA uracil-C5-methylase (TrmA/RlmC/RlmD family)